MDQTDSDITNRLTRLANEADKGGVQRARDAATAVTRRPVAWASIAAAAAIVAGAAVGIGYLGGSETGNNQATRDQSNGFVPLPVNDGEPCAMARSVPLDVLQKTSLVPIIMPDSPVASNETLSGTWLCGDIPLLEFNELRLSFESGWADVDPIKKFEELQRDYGGEVTDVRGHPAWINPASDESQQLELLLVNAGSLIRFSTDYGSALTEGDLLDAANSLDLTTG